MENNEFELNIDDILAEFSGESETRSTPVQKKPAQPKEAKKVPESRPVPAKQKAKEEKKPVKERKPREKAKTAKSPAITTAAAFILAIGLLFCLVNVHPAASISAKKPSEPVQTEQPHEELQSEPTPIPIDTDDEKQQDPAEEEKPVEETVSRPSYSIPDDAAAAYRPDSEGFGEISLDNAQETMDVIQRARDSGLLGKDERVIFDPNAEFNRGSHSEPIMYYLDDSIMVICWKEIIDGNTCTLSEIKISDGSQFRKKVVGDIYSQNETDYLTSIALGANAVVAFGADKFKARPEGIVIQDRTLYRYEDKVRTGEQRMYNALDNLMVTSNGDFLFTHRYEVFSREELEQRIRENDVVFSLSFGPILIENGVLNEEYWPVDRSTEYAAGQVFDEYSRAGIGQVGELHYLYMSLNHSEEKLARWTMEQFAKHFAEKDVINAYGLDGGQTSEVVFNNYIYSYIDHNNERLTSDGLYFGSAVPR